MALRNIKRRGAVWYGVAGMVSLVVCSVYGVLHGGV